MNFFIIFFNLNIIYSKPCAENISSILLATNTLSKTSTIVVISKLVHEHSEYIR